LQCVADRNRAYDEKHDGSLVGETVNPDREMIDDSGRAFAVDWRE
jgi:hypothetical protein